MKRKKRLQRAVKVHPSSEEMLADAQARVERLKAEHRSDEVVARYEAERARHQAIVDGKRGITRAYDLPQLLLPQDVFSQYALQYRFDWPPLIQVHDAGARIKVTVRAALIRELKALLLFSRSKKERQELAEAFEDFQQDLPSGVDAKTAKAWLVKVSITAVIRSAGDWWEGRIGSGRRFGGVPAAASEIGFNAWVRQETLKQARTRLRTYRKPRPELIPWRREVDKKTGDVVRREEEWGVEADKRAPQVEIEDAEFEPDPRWTPFVKAWAQCKKDERLIWLADWPGIFLQARAAAVLPEERVAFTLTPKEEETLTRDLRDSSNDDLARRFGWETATAAAKVSNARDTCIDKIATATGAPRKELRAWLHAVRRGESPF